MDDILTPIILIWDEELGGFFPKEDYDELLGEGNEN